MSKEMLKPSAFGRRQRDQKEDIIKQSQNHCVQLIARRYGQSESAAIEFNEETGDFRVYTVREVIR